MVAAVGGRGRRDGLRVVMRETGSVRRVVRVVVDMVEIEEELEGLTCSV